MGMAGMKQPARSSGGHDVNAAAQSFEQRAMRSFFPTFSDIPSLDGEGPMIVTGGEGAYVLDAAGKRYLEGNSGLWNMVLGFSDGRLAEAARKQYDSFPGYHTFFGRNSRPSVELAERIVSLAPVPMSRAFFTNSGSEANESVAKLLWMMWRGEGQPQRRKFLSRRNAYHGATVLATSLTGKDYVEAFGLPRSGVVMLSCPHLWRYGGQGESEEAFVARLAAELEETIAREGADTIAGMFAEPVMGAGGVIVPPASYFPAIRPILRKHGIPLVGDEVICGFGRTGELWGAQAVGQTPDIIVASKSISAGYFPMGAVMLSEEIDRRASAACAQWDEFPHGFTAGGHPVGCAVSLEAIRIITEEGALGHVQQIAPFFQLRLKALQAHPLVGEARGIGLMGALEIVADKESKHAFDGSMRMGERISRIARKRGLIIRPLGSSLVIAPPFILEPHEVDWLFMTLEETLDIVARDIGRLAA